MPNNKANEPEVDVEEKENEQNNKDIDGQDSANLEDHKPAGGLLNHLRDFYPGMYDEKGNLIDGGGNGKEDGKEKEGKEEKPDASKGEEEEGKDKEGEEGEETPAEEDKDDEGKGKPTDGKGDNEDEEESDYEGKSSEELIPELKKQQRINNERTAKIKELEDKVEELSSKTGITDEKMQKFLQDFRSNPEQALKNYKEDLNLPDPETVKTLFSEGGDQMVKKLKYHVKNVLIPEVEKKFDLDKGTFRYDADEAIDEDTPSGYFELQKNRKRQELEQEVTKKAEDFQKLREQALARNQQDVKYLAGEYYEGDEAKVQERYETLHNLPAQIQAGKMEAEKHPLALRNIYRGVFFDELAQQKVDKATADVKAKLERLFAERGVSIELPDDLSKLKKAEDVKKKKAKHTGVPSIDAMNAYL